MRLVRGNLLWVVVLVVAIMAGFSQRLTVHTTMPTANVWDILVPVQADLYLVAYLFLPVWIFRLGVELPNRADETWLLRYGSRLRWLLRTGSWALGQAAMLLLVWLLACAIVAAGLPSATSWSHIADPDGNDVLLAALQRSDLGPLSSWALQWVAYLALLLTIFIVLAMTTLLTAKPWQRYLGSSPSPKPRWKVSRCSFSTSRSTPWTPPAPNSSRTCCATTAPQAAPSSSPATAPRTSIGLPTTPTASMPAASSPSTPGTDGSALTRSRFRPQNRPKIGPLPTSRLP